MKGCIIFITINFWILKVFINSTKIYFDAKVGEIQHNKKYFLIMHGSLSFLVFQKCVSGFHFFSLHVIMTKFLMSIGWMWDETSFPNIYLKHQACKKQKFHNIVISNILCNKYLFSIFIIIRKDYSWFHNSYYFW